MEEQSRTRAHHTWAERADECQFWPIATTACVADTNRFCMCGRIAGLHTQIMALRDDVPVVVCQYCAYWYTTFMKPSSCFFNGSTEERVIMLFLAEFIRPHFEGHGPLRVFSAFPNRSFLHRKRPIRSTAN